MRDVLNALLAGGRGGQRRKKDSGCRHGRPRAHAGHHISLYGLNISQPCLCVMNSMHVLQVAAEGNAARRILADGMVASAPAPAVMSASGMAAVVDTAHQTGIASADGMASVAATVTKAMANSVKGPHHPHARRHPGRRGLGVPPPA